MAHLKDAAVKALVSTCTHISMSAVQDDNFQLWREVLRDVLPHCKDCPSPVAPLRDLAHSIVFCEGEQVHAAKIRMYYAVKAYFQHSAALNCDAFRNVRHSKAAA